MSHSPVPFQGTDEERAVNRATHNFFYDHEGNGECMGCACKPWHVAASYPCGVEPPREENPNAAAEQYVRFAAYAMAVSE